MDKYGLMYFVDATMIRKVDQNGIISTLLGSNDLTAVRPLSCDSSMDVTQVQCYFLFTYTFHNEADGCLFWITAISCLQGEKTQNYMLYSPGRGEKELENSDIMMTHNVRRL